MIVEGIMGWGGGGPGGADMLPLLGGECPMAELIELLRGANVGGEMVWCDC